MKRLTCTKCATMVVCHMMTNSKCKKCEKGFVSNHIPENELCDECAKRLNKCQQCGRDL